MIEKMLPRVTWSACALSRVSRPSQGRQFHKLTTDLRTLQLCRRVSRPYSTVPPPPPQVQAQPLEPVLNTSEPPLPRQKRNIRPFIYATIFFIIGATTGQYMALVVNPPPLPLPGTPEDEALSSWIFSRAENLPIVKSLSSDPNFVSWPAYSAFAEHERPHRMTTGPLGGSRGLGGYQRIFYNKETGEMISVLWIGGALAGWPGVVHGGLLATVLDETLGRCGIARFETRTGVTANLEVNYKRPTMTNSFVVVRCLPVLEGSTERKAYVQGRVETLDGKICVEAKGLFVSPKALKLRSFEAPGPGKGF